MIKILIQINRCLNAVFVDLLPEIAMSIEQTNGNETEVEIARRLAMVASEYAKTPRIIRDRFVKTKFSREIGDRILDRASSSCLSVSVVASEIFFEFLKDLLQLAQESFVLCKFFQPGLPRKLKHSDGIVICPVPKLGIQMAKEPARGRFPRPPQVEAHLAQRLERRRQDGSHVIRLKSRHASSCSRGR